MKAILEFNLPDDQVEFSEAVNGGQWKHAMWTLDQWLRSQTKYAPDSQDENYTKALYDARDHLWEILQENSLKMD